ncbi:MBOAT family protein [Acetivibrio sp. MSJd-27]|nr:MBOAT family protein [Acetivibrio sp. MSJd-27]
MVFSSPIFLFFFLPICLWVYFLTPKRLKNLVLLIASLFFYAWGEPFFILLMLASILLNYMFAFLIDRHSGKLWLAIGVSCNLLFLIFFKYFNMLVQTANHFFAVESVLPEGLKNIALPIGISFYTFQIMSYIIDVYRKNVPVQKNILKLALYISLFPQLIAGPIVRYTDVVEQIDSRKTDAGKICEGISRFIVGLSKKVLISNTVAQTADLMFHTDSAALEFWGAWLGIICYTLQIYFDFSGYSDMAIGLGKMFGFDFLENFNYPYISKSIQEFWRRWHISLSSWFRDYLYIPLGGNRKGKTRTYLNNGIVFLLCGLWHGASWTFAFWGLYHGFFLILEKMFLGRYLEKVWTPFQHLYALLVVMAGWVFFRADTFCGAVQYLKAMAGMNGFGSVDPLHLSFYLFAVLLIAAVASAPVLPKIKERFHGWKRGTAEFLTLSVLFLLCSAFLAGNEYNPFIYFRF